MSEMWDETGKCEEGYRSMAMGCAAVFMYGEQCVLVFTGRRFS